MNKKYDIFISYSRKDSDIVYRYCKYLEQEGLSVWVDKRRIRHGDAFRAKIVDAIDYSDVFVFFSSANSNASEWIEREVDVAYDSHKRIIPVKLDTAPYSASIRFNIAGIDYINHADLGFEAGAESLLSLFKKNDREANENVKNESAGNVASSSEDTVLPALVNCRLLGKTAQPPSVNEYKGCLRVVQTEQIVTLSPGHHTIGRYSRNPKATIMVGDPDHSDREMSRCHIELDIVQGPLGLQHRVRDVGKNRMKLNGAEIPHDSVVVVNYGDRLCLGNTDLVLETNEPNALANKQKKSRKK